MATRKSVGRPRKKKKKKKAYRKKSKARRTTRSPEFERVIKKIYLENTNGKHNKFYELNIIRVDQSNEVYYRFDTRWGRIGCKGSSLKGVRHCNTFEEVSIYVDDIAQVKKSKGYVEAGKSRVKLDEKTKTPKKLISPIMERMAAVLE